VRVKVQLDGAVGWPEEVIALRLDLSGGGSGSVAGEDK
jgi:general secretion pathway protein J